MSVSVAWHGPWMASLASSSHCATNSVIWMTNPKRTGWCFTLRVQPCELVSIMEFLIPLQLKTLACMSACPKGVWNREVSLYVRISGCMGIGHTSFTYTTITITKSTSKHRDYIVAIGQHNKQMNADKRYSTSCQSVYTQKKYINTSSMLKWRLQYDMQHKPHSHGGAYIHCMCLCVRRWAKYYKEHKYVWCKTSNIIWHYNYQSVNTNTTNRWLSKRITHVSSAIWGKPWGWPVGGVHGWKSPVRGAPTEHLRGIFWAGIGRPRPVTLTLG